MSFYRRLVATFRSGRVERELDAELQFHIDQRTEDLVAQGLTPVEARRQAALVFGHRATLREATRERDILDWLETTLRDLRFGLRMLRRGPGFTAAAVITLALGIGATTAVFSVVHAVILRQLQFPDSDRVMTILAASDNGKPFWPMEFAYMEWRKWAKSFDAFAGGFTSIGNGRIAGDWLEVRTAAVSAGFFDLIGVRPELGRLFSPEEDELGHNSVALIDDEIWRRKFGRDPGVLGQTVVLGNSPLTIIGVLPPDTRFPGSGRRDLWTPLAAYLSLGCGGKEFLTIGRLRPGVTRGAAQAEIDALRPHIAKELACGMRRGIVMPLRDWLTEGIRGQFLMLAGAAAFLMLIACANLANLMLARGTGRRREMAIRAAIGAGRWRLAAQSMTESLLLAAIGGLFGVALASAAVRAAPAIKAIEIPRGDEIAVDWSFLLIGLGVSVASGVLFGLGPAFQSWRRDLNAGLYRGEAPSGRTRGQGLRHTLVAAQLALAMVLLSGAGLMTNTLLRLVNVDLGFTPSSVLEVDPALPPSPPITKPDSYDMVAGWKTVEAQIKSRQAEFLRQAAERVRSIPGVESVSVGNQAPLGEVGGGYELSYNGAAGPRKLSSQGRDVDPGYFRTAGIPLLSGRDIEPADASTRPLPIVVNRAAARELFGSDEPLGKVVGCSYPKLAMQVVGVAGDARLRGVAERPKPEVFVPLMGGWGYASLLILRTAAPPSLVTPAIRAAVRSLDTSLPPPKITALEDLLSGQTAKPRFYMTLLDSFAGIGLILAAVGIYGVMAYAVARRTHEFGVRLALGATPDDILRLALGSGVRVIAAGVVVGMAGALAVTRLLSSLLYEVKPRDPITLAATAAVLAAITLTACWLAARQSTAVDPTVALRCE
jgi:predicted permease